MQFLPIEMIETLSRHDEVLCCTLASWHQLGKYKKESENIIATLTPSLPFLPNTFVLLATFDLIT